MTSLSDARAERDRMRELVKAGGDPKTVDALAALDVSPVAPRGPTFREIGAEWLALMRGQWSPVHYGDVSDSLDRLIYPAIGDLEIAKLRPMQVLPQLQAIASKSPETAKRCRQRVSAICGLAIATGRAEVDPAAHLSVALPKPASRRNPATSTIEDLHHVLRTVENRPGYPQVKLALRFLALVAVRVSVVYDLRWNELPELKAGETWVIRANKMKLTLDRKQDDRFAHHVPLSAEAIEVLKAARTINPRSPVVFPGVGNPLKGLSANTLNVALRNSGFAGTTTAHGLRASFATILNEIRPDLRLAIDMALSHQPTGVSATEAVYNRSLLMAQRKEVFDLWGKMVGAGLKPASDLLTGPVRTYGQKPLVGVA